MLKNGQNDLYFERMNYALNDKLALLSYIRSGKILDVGAGSGDLSKALSNIGNEVYALDASYEALENIRRFPDIKAVEGTAPSKLSEFSNNSFDTIVCSSILHEIYSYGESSETAYSLENISKSFSEFYRLLKPGGRLLIRDGVMPDNWDEKVFLKFSDSKDVEEYLKKYSSIAPFYNSSGDKRTVYLEKLSKGIYKTNMSSAMELLFTYNWGFESVEREAREYYGVYTESEYSENLKNVGFKILGSSQYLQDGYVRHLSPKVEITDRQGDVVSLPSSNMVIVSEKAS